MKRVSQITRANEEELQEIAKQRIENFPILGRIYNDDFLSILVQRKNDLDNHLLHLLILDDPSLTNFFQEVEENLQTLQSERSIETFKTKLKQWNSIQFESAITELEFTAEFKRKGFQIELEPILPNNRRGDFCASKDSLKIYFEIKNIFTKQTLKDEAITDELMDRLSRIDEPFMIGIDLKKSFKRKDTVNVARYIRKKLRQLEKIPVSLPFSFAYPENGEPMVEIDVHLRLPKDEKGFISGFAFPAMLIGDWSDLRYKISSGVSQLHPNYPGVIILQPHGLVANRYDIENALWGDLKVNLFGEPRAIRGGDSIFAPTKNNRLSAVIYYERRLQETGYTKKKFVYHNLFAKTKLDPEIFEGENVTQIILKKLDEGTIYSGQVMVHQISKLTPETRKIMSDKLKKIIDEELNKSEG